MGAATEASTAGRLGKQEWIGLLEAATHFGVSRYTLARAARDGNLSTRRTGKTWLTTPAAVETWLKGARHRPGRTPQRRPSEAPPRASSPEISVPAESVA